MNIEKKIEISQNLDNLEIDSIEIDNKEYFTYKYFTKIDNVESFPIVLVNNNEDNKYNIETFLFNPTSNTMEGKINYPFVIEDLKDQRIKEGLFFVFVYETILSEFIKIFLTLEERKNRNEYIHFQHIFSDFIDDLYNNYKKSDRIGYQLEGGEMSFTINYSISKEDIKIKYTDNNINKELEIQNELLEPHNPKNIQFIFKLFKEYILNIKK